MSKAIYRLLIFRIIALILGFLIVSYILLIHNSWHSNAFILAIDSNLETVTVDQVDMSEYKEVIDGDHDSLIVRKLTLQNVSFINQKYRYSFIQNGPPININHTVYIYKEGLLQKTVHINSGVNPDYFEQYLDFLESKEIHEYFIFIALDYTENNGSETILDFEIQIERQYKIFS